MVAKKTKKAQPKAKSNGNGAAKKVAVANTKESIAVRALANLPAIDDKLRRAYRASFTDEQSETWGRRTKAEQVIREAEKWISIMAPALAKSPDSGYSQRRLAWLCELVVALEDELARTTGKLDHSDVRGVKTSAMKVALRARQEILSRLHLIAAGRTELRTAITARAGDGTRPSQIQASLTALIDLGVRWRRLPELEILAEDFGLTEARLNSAYNALEALSRADERVNSTAPTNGDAPSVNVIEGRVLRELKLAEMAFSDARARGANLPPLVPSSAVRGVFAHAEPSTALKPAGKPDVPPDEMPTPPPPP